ncbi:MAG: hypothetical protein IKN89_04800 [Oscillospiraceae bacterium]|nr:hypothetical protein [Oscillospiraceae bacterium]
MKRFSRIILPAALFLLLCLLAGCAGKPKEIRGIFSVRFAYSNGMQLSDQAYYSLERTADGCKAMVKPRGIDPSEPLTVEVDEEFVGQVEELLRTNHVEKWYGYKKRARNIMDGIGFTFYLKLEDGKEVDAVGYMNWPDGYANVEAGMDSLFLGLWEAAGRKLPPEYGQ